MEFLQEYWGLISLGVMVVLFIIKHGWDEFKLKLAGLIFIAEEQAREKALVTGKRKYEWVAKNGYAYLPNVLQLFISKALFEKIIQSIFERMVRWAEERGLSKTHK